jgi:hypothetical protein
LCFEDSRAHTDVTVVDTASSLWSPSLVP